MAVLIALLFASIVLTEKADARGGDLVDLDVKYHTVVKGDTLWDISSRYLKDPFRWPSIWKRPETVPCVAPLIN